MRPIPTLKQSPTRDLRKRKFKAMDSHPSAPMKRLTPLTAENPRIEIVEASADAGDGVAGGAMAATDEIEARIAMQPQSRIARQNVRRNELRSAVSSAALNEGTNLDMLVPRKARPR